MGDEIAVALIAGIFQLLTVAVCGFLVWWMNRQPLYMPWPPTPKPPPKVDDLHARRFAAMVEGRPIPLV